MRFNDLQLSQRLKFWEKWFKEQRAIEKEQRAIEISEENLQDLLKDIKLDSRIKSNMKWFSKNCITPNERKLRSLLNQALVILRDNYGSLSYDDPARTSEHNLMDEIEIILDKK